MSRQLSWARFLNRLVGERAGRRILQSSQVTLAQMRSRRVLDVARERCIAGAAGARSHGGGGGDDAGAAGADAAAVPAAAVGAAAAEQSGRSAQRKTASRMLQAIHKGN